MMSTHDADRGSLSIEYVILVPLVLLVMALIYIFGRVANVNGTLDASTRDATRVASEAPSYEQAQQAARQVVQSAVGDTSSTCRKTLSVTVSDNFAPGNTITVRATCRYSIADAGLPGAPGTLTVTSMFASIIDPNRTLQQ